MRSSAESEKILSNKEKIQKKTRTDEMVQIEVCLIHIKVYNSKLIREEKAKKLKKIYLHFANIPKKNRKRDKEKRTCLGFVWTQDVSQIKEFLVESVWSRSRVQNSSTCRKI